MPTTGIPDVQVRSRTERRTARGTLVFRPVYVQRGRGPHLNWAYATDTLGDAFKCDIEAPQNGQVTISDAAGQERFGINTRWNVEDFGYIFLTADNAGEFYELPPPGEEVTLNLNLELARSRVVRNRRRRQKHETDGYAPSREVQGLIDMSEGYLEDAERAEHDEQRTGRLAQESLRHALYASEALELEKSRFDIARRAVRDDFFIGCDARAFFQMDPDIFMEGFLELFDYATITYYLKYGGNGIPDFEPIRGDRRYDERDALLGRLRSNGVTVEGRPLFWPYPSVSPDWIREMSYDDALKYVETHVREVVGHYGDRMYAWEVVNEFHDWANEIDVTPDQAVEITRLACEVAKDTAPNVHRLVNNCCPFAEFVQVGNYQDRPALYPQRTPWQFMRDLVDADVDFTITGQQMYFPHRDFQDIIILVERYEQFGRPVQLTEVGTSSGPTRRSIADESLPLPTEPHYWRRHWDQNLQADWLENLYTLCYSRPWIEACNWYDYLDPESWIKNGGLVSDREGTRKAAFDRLKRLKQEWSHGS